MKESEEKEHKVFFFLNTGNKIAKLKACLKLEVR